MTKIARLSHLASLLSYGTTAREVTMNHPRQFLENHLVIASHNGGKIREISALLAPFGINCESAKSLGLIEPEETGDTYLENALQIEASLKNRKKLA